MLIKDNIRVNDAIFISDSWCRFMTQSSHENYIKIIEKAVFFEDFFINAGVGIIESIESFPDDPDRREFVCAVKWISLSIKNRPFYYHKVPDISDIRNKMLIFYDNEEVSPGISFEKCQKNT